MVAYSINHGKLHTQVRNGIAFLIHNRPGSYMCHQTQYAVGINIAVKLTIKFHVFTIVFAAGGKIDSVELKTGR